MGAPLRLRKAAPADVHQLVGLMTEFYAESPYTLNPKRAIEAFAPLLADDRLGHAWFIQVNSQDVGYLVMILSYSMEHGGTVAILDDFYVRSASRGVGIGSTALAEICQWCAGQGIRAVHVETGDDNAAALKVYQRCGFVDTHRVHLTLKLAEPTHAL